MQKNNTTKIEAQGGEIVIRNSYDDVAIIPRNLVKKYQAYMKAGCDECIDELVASLPAMSQYAADGTVIPQGKKVKVTLPDGEQAEYSTDSVEYKNLYNSGKLANVVKDKATGEDVYIMPSLKEVEITGKATGAARDMIDTKKSYSKEQYVKEKLPAFAGSLGVTADNLGGNAEGYKRAINTKVAENILKRKPNAKEKDLTPYEINVIENSDLAYKLKPDILERFEQGALSVGNAGSPVKFKNPNLTPRQARAENNPLNILAPIEYGSKAVQALYKPGYTLKDVTKGKANNAGILEDMITDPLNLLGLGLMDDGARVLGKGAKALSKERQIAGSIEKMQRIPDYRYNLDLSSHMNPKQARINERANKVLKSKLLSDDRVFTSQAFLDSADKELYKLIEATRTDNALSPAEKQIRMARYRILTQEGKKRLGENYPEFADTYLNKVELERSPLSHASYTEYPLVGQYKIDMHPEIRSEASTARHELEHVGQYRTVVRNINERSIDDEMSKLKLLDKESLINQTPEEVRIRAFDKQKEIEDIENSDKAFKDYFRIKKETAVDKYNDMNTDKVAAADYFTNNVRERSAFLAEFQTYAVERGHLHEYNKMTPKIAEDFIKHSKTDVQEALRILGIGEESADNYKLISDNFNKLFGVGAGIIGGSMTARTLKDQLNKNKSK
jgi:hypothetical protein